MLRTKPPFRADHVGSFLRTAAIKDARAKHEKGAITAEQLKAIEDAEIRKIIAHQEQCGLQLATDGEFRRSWWHFDFLCGLDGVVMKQIAQEGRNQVQAAKILGITRATLRKRIEKFGITQQLDIR